MVIALWAALGTGVATFRLCTVLGLSALAGFVAAYGWWGWHLYGLTGNPIFPMLNDVFHSPWGPATGGRDMAFMPRSLTQWVFYPFYWVTKNRTQGGNSFADARYASALVGVLLMAATCWAARRWRPAESRANRFVLVFVVSGYIGWLFLYSILRYAVSLEVLTGLVVLLAVQRLGDMPRWRNRADAWVFGVMIVISCLLLGFSRYTDWGHARYATVAFDVKPGAIEPGSMVVMLGQPHAYVIPFFENTQSAVFVGLTWLTEIAKDFRLGELSAERITSHRGPMYAVMRDSSEADLSQFRRLLPAATLLECRPIESAMESTVRGTDLVDGLRICRVR